jgi:hypothetical protein
MLLNPVSKDSYDISHAVPDFRINGALSSMHITIDTEQYKLIRGILDHNLGEKLPEFQKALMSHLMVTMNGVRSHNFEI